MLQEGLNAVKLKCQNDVDISSYQSPWGGWSEWAECDYGDLIKSYRIKNLRYRGGGDDLGAVSVEMRCGNGKLLAPITYNPWYVKDALS